MTDQPTNGNGFFHGTMRSDVDHLQEDVADIKKDVKAIRDEMGEWKGALKMWGAVPGGVAIAISIYTAFFK